MKTVTKFAKFATKAAQFTATVASAALLASTAIVPEAIAFSLRHGDDDRVIGIDGLEVEESVYNVDFIDGSFNDSFGDGDSFLDADSAKKAFSAVQSALGKKEWLVPGRKHLYEYYDGFMIPFMSEDGEIDIIMEKDSKLRYDSGSSVIGESSSLYDLDKDYSQHIYARVTDVTAPPDIPTTTPEPSLIFGFITLGGLMLGSKRKTKC